MSRFFCVLFIGLSVLISMAAHAQDLILTSIKQSENDQRADYKLALLNAIFDETLKDFGPYSIDSSVGVFSRDRALSEMLKGELINVYTVPADLEWEDQTLAIRIPIRRGLLNYRLLLTTQNKVEALSQVTNSQELHTFMMGLQSQWTTTKIMQSLGFESINGASYDGVFKMLAAERFDYIPRGVNEIFAEVDVRRDEMPNLIIEPKLALYIPLPVYFYVSPNHPRIAKRLQTGFERILENGKFEELFLAYFAESIQAANLSQRHIIYLGNPLLSPQTPLDQPRYWFYPIENTGK